jgi:hypothetical protein
MKTKEKIQKSKAFDTVKTFRAIKEQVSRDIKDMTYEQLREYFDKTKLKTGNS